MNYSERIKLRVEDKTAVVTLNYPEKKNSFDSLMWDSLDKLNSDLKEMKIRAVIITGSGSDFSAGFDVSPENSMISSISNSVASEEKEPVEKLIKKIRGIVDDFVSLPVPIIAAVNGIAYGGGAELAVRCDMRIMEPSAVICFSEVTLGLMPDWGGCAALPYVVGPAKAAEFILTAKKIDADEALKAGLVNSVSKPGKSLEEALSLAKKISMNGPNAVKSALSVIRESKNLSYNETLDLESEKAVELILSGECFYGITAFLSKKEPDFPDI